MAVNTSVSVSWYTSGLDEFENRSHSALTVAKHLGKISTRIGLDKCRSLLSIGPGPGHVDVPLVRDYLPSLEQYYGVEPRADALHELRRWIQKDIGDRLKITVFEGIAEDWPGQPDDEKVDAILMIHVLYYVPDVCCLLRRCMSWLRPGGVICIIHSPPEGIFQRAGNFANPESVASYTTKELIQDLKATGLDSWQEESIPIEIDVRNPSKDLIDYLMHKDALPREVTKINEMFAKFATSGVYHEEERLFIITK